MTRAYCVSNSVRRFLPSGRLGPRTGPAFEKAVDHAAHTPAYPSLEPVGIWRSVLYKYHTWQACPCCVGAIPTTLRAKADRAEAQPRVVAEAIRSRDRESTGIGRPVETMAEAEADAERKGKVEACEESRERLMKAGREWAIVLK